MTGLLESLGSLAGPSAYVVVSLLAALEASAFVGLFVPGELAMLVGGYIAYEGRASLALMMIFATVGAAVGDSVGYEIGRYLGHSMRRSRLGQKVGDERWERAEHYLVVRGGRAVFFGRFIGVLRALVPALAGASGMKYRRFLVWNVLGAAIWAPSLVGLGYLAGGSYRRVEHYAGRAGLILLVLLAMIGGVGALGHWVSRNQEKVHAFGRRILARPGIARVYARYRGQLVFLGRRFKPGQALGLALTLQLAVLGLAGWAFGSVVQDVATGRGAARIDMPISKALLSRRVPWLTTTMKGVTDMGSMAILVVAAVAVGLLARKLTKNWLPFVVLGAALVGGWLVPDLVKPLVGRVRPQMGALVAKEGYSFPSGHAAQAIALYGAVAWLGAGWLRSWRGKVAAWTVALLLVLMVGFSRVYLGVHWTTDVLGGYALGAVWLAVVLVTTSAIQGAWRRHHHRIATGVPTLDPGEAEAGAIAAGAGAGEQAEAEAGAAP